MNTTTKSGDPRTSTPGSPSPRPPKEQKGNFIMARSTDTHQSTAANHGCGVSWCINKQNSSPPQRAEHMSLDWYGSATGDILSRMGSAYGEMVLSVGVGLRFNADVDNGPAMFVHLHGGQKGIDAEAVLQITEAVLLHKAMGDFLRQAVVDSDLDPDAVCEYYNQPADL